MKGHLPPVLLARADHFRLRRLVNGAMGERDPVGMFLMSEINRARLYGDGELPGNVARLNGWVTYRVDGSNRTECKVLVCPDDFRSPQVTVSVLSPLGAALVGLPVGSRLRFVGLDNDWHFVEVEGVDVPPNAPALFPVRTAARVATPPGDSDPDGDGPSAA